MWMYSRLCLAFVRLALHWCSSQAEHTCKVPLARQPRALSRLHVKTATQLRAITQSDQGAEDAEKEVQRDGWKEWRVNHPLFTTKEKITKATADTFLEGLGEEFASVEHLHECTRNGLGWEAEKLRRRVEQHQAIIQVVADTLKAAWGITDEDALRINRNWQGFPIYGQGTSYSIFDKASLAEGWMNMAHNQAGYELRISQITREEEKPAKEDEPEPPREGDDMYETSDAEKDEEDEGA